MKTPHCAIVFFFDHKGIPYHVIALSEKNAEEVTQQLKAAVANRELKRTLANASKYGEEYKLMHSNAHFSELYYLLRAIGICRSIKLPLKAELLLSLLAKGLDKKEVCRTIKMSNPTYNTTMSRIKKKIPAGDVQSYIHFIKALHLAEENKKKKPFK